MSERNRVNVIKLGQYTLSNEKWPKIGFNFSLPIVLFF